MDEDPILHEADVVSDLKKVNSLFKKVSEKKKPKKPKAEKT